MKFMFVGRLLVFKVPDWIQDAKVPLGSYFLEFLARGVQTLLGVQHNILMNRAMGLIFGARI